MYVIYSRQKGQLSRPRKCFANPIQSRPRASEHQGKAPILAPPTPSPDQKNFSTRRHATHAPVHSPTVPRITATAIAATLKPAPPPPPASAGRSGSHAIPTTAHVTAKSEFDTTTHIVQTSRFCL